MNKISRRDDGQVAVVETMDSACKIHGLISYSTIEYDNVVLRQALVQSVKLQSHYAKLLNDYDDGKRMTFDADSWLARLAVIRASEALAQIIANTEFMAPPSSDGPSPAQCDDFLGKRHYTEKKGNI